MRSFIATLCVIFIGCGHKSDHHDEASPDLPARGGAETQGANVTSPDSTADTDHTDHEGHSHAADGDDDDGVDGKIASKNNLYLVKIVWENAPVAGTLDNHATVHFNSMDGEHVPAVLKAFRLYHSSMGHGSIKEKDMVFKALDEAHWDVSNIYFSMPGAAGSWVVDIEAVVNGQTDTARVPVETEVN